MSDEKRRSQMQEELLSLYLRLNGFFVTGLSSVPTLIGAARLSC